MPHRRNLRATTDFAASPRRSGASPEPRAPRPWRSRCAGAWQASRAVSISQSQQTAVVTFVSGTRVFSAAAFREAVAEADVEVVSLEADVCGVIDGENALRSSHARRSAITAASRWHGRRGKRRVRERATERARGAVRTRRHDGTPAQLVQSSQRDPGGDMSIQSSLAALLRLESPPVAITFVDTPPAGVRACCRL